MGSVAKDAGRVGDVVGHAEVLDPDGVAVPDATLVGRGRTVAKVGGQILGNVGVSVTKHICATAGREAIGGASRG